MFRSLAFLFLIPTLPAFAEPADDSDLHCPVPAPLNAKIENGSVTRDPWSLKMAEASPLEAARRASQDWRKARDASINQELDPRWLDRFDNCLKASGLEFSEVVENPAQFRAIVGRTLRGNIENIRNRADVEDVSRDFERFEKRVKAMGVLAPELGTSFLPNAEEKNKLLVSSQIAAETHREACAEMDLSHDFGPVRNQADMGWCFGYALADLVTFKAKKAGRSDAMQVSAVDIGLRHNALYYSEKAKNEGLGAGQQSNGFPQDALKEVLDSGFCSEKNAPSENFAFGTLKETLNEIERLKTQALTTEPGIVSCQSFAQAKQMFPGISFDDFSEILKASADDSLEYFKKLDEKNCEGKRSTLGIEMRNVRVGYALSRVPAEQHKQAQDVIDLLNAQLAKGNPVQMDIKANVLMAADPKSHAITTNGKKFEPMDQGAHVINVVGRKFDEKTKTCKFLLRNTWGASCSPNLKPGICDEARPGHLWLKEADLRNNLRGYFYLE